MNSEESGKETEDTVENKESIKDATLDLRTLLQVDATSIVGVLFFLSLTSFGGVIGGGLGRAIYAGFTTLVVLPFGLSATTIISIDLYRYVKVSQLPQKFLSWLSRKPIRHTTNYDITVSTAYTLVLAFARLSTIGGFVYLGLTIIIISGVAFHLLPSPKQFGVENHPWKCSMFTEGSLAELCVTYHNRFNMPSIKECSKFIPDQVATTPPIS